LDKIKKNKKKDSTLGILDCSYFSPHLHQSAEYDDMSLTLEFFTFFHFSFNPCGRPHHLTFHTYIHVCMYVCRWFGVNFVGIRWKPASNIGNI